MNEKAKTNIEAIMFTKEEIEKLASDIEWYLTMHTWESTHKALEKTEEVEKRLWDFVFRYGRKKID